MFLSSRVYLASFELTIFNMIDRESQSMAAALSVKVASDLLVRFLLAMLDAWGRSDVKVLLRFDQEVTFTLILREVQVRRQQRTVVECSPVESHAALGAMERANWTHEAPLLKVGGREHRHPKMEERSATPSREKNGATTPKQRGRKSPPLKRRREAECTTHHPPTHPKSNQTSAPHHTHTHTSTHTQAHTT